MTRGAGWSEASKAERGASATRCLCRSRAAVISLAQLHAFLALGLTHRQGDAETRPLAHRAVQVDAAMVLVDDAVGNRQAQPGAAAHRLGGEERIEDTLAQFRRDAAAVVLDLHPHLITAGAGADHDMPALGHRLA